MKPLNIAFTIFLLCLLNNGISAQGKDFAIVYDGSAKTFKTTGLKPPPETTGTSDKKPPVWLLFWEFGDGHYAVQEQKEGKNPTMRHEYANPGLYKVRLYFTPLYARYVPKPPARTVSISVDDRHTGNPRESYPFRGKSRVNIATNANEEAIPGHNIRVAFGKEAKAPGHLLLLFNPTEANKKIGFDPFIISDEGGTLPDFHESILRKKTWSNFLRIAQGQLSSQDLDFIGDKVVNQYNDRVVFEVVKKDYPNAFYSLLVKEELGEKLSLVKKVSMAAIWVPEDGSFSRERDFQEFDLEVLDVHDPNKIIVNPRRLFFKRKSPKDVEVKVKFKNTGNGIVEEADIKLEVSKDFNVQGEGVISIDTTECDPPLNLYREGIDEEILRTVRWRTVPGKHKDSLIFTIKGLGLEKKEKGELIFNLKSSGDRPRSSKIDGGIYFIGATKIEKLSAARPTWRQKGFFLEVGSPLVQSMRFNRVSSNPDFSGEGEFNSAMYQERQTDNFFISLTRQNAPMENGLLYWDYGIRYSKSTVLSDDRIISNEEYELVKAQHLGLNASIGLQLKNIVRLKGSLGVDLPLSLTTYNSYDREPFFFTEANPTDFGILQEKDSRLATARPSYFTGVTAEFGFLHSISGGIRVNYHRSPEVYRRKSFESCFSTQNGTECYENPEISTSSNSTTLSVFLKFKLGTLGGKK